MKLVISSKLTDPYFIAASILYGLALIGLAFVSSSWWSALLLGLGVLLLGGIVLVVTNKQVPQPIAIIRPQAELWSALIWYGLVVLLATITLASGLELVNQFTNWFFLVFVPLGLLVLTRGHAVYLRDALRSVGLTRTNIKDAMKLAVLIMPLTIPLLYTVGDQQRAAIQMIFHAPLRAVMSFLASFVLALLTAGFVEEFFFRGILQSRLAACLGSEWRGLLVASFLFGLLHLPMYYFSPFEPTRGNLVWAVTSIITEQTAVGVLLGVVWVRTHNLTAPVLLHAFIDALAMMSALKIGTG
jgi:membrane protease YdiL (CAAX protease family)